MQHLPELCAIAAAQGCGNDVLAALGKLAAFH